MPNFAHRTLRSLVTVSEIRENLPDRKSSGSNRIMVVAAGVYVDTRTGIRMVNTDRTSSSLSYEQARRS